MLTVVENKDQTADVFSNNELIASFAPEIDLDKSMELLEHFNNISAINGQKIYELWEHEGYYFYPAFQEWLYWDFFVGIVHHKKARLFLRDKEYKFNNPKYYITQRLHRIHNCLNSKHHVLLRVLLNITTFLSRLLKQSGSLLIHDDGDDGFRYRHLKTALREKLYSRIEYVNPSNLLSIIRKKNIYWSGSKKIKYPRMSHLFDYQSIGCLKEYITETEFFQLIESINRRCQDAIYELKIVKNDIKKRNIDCFITYDQIERVVPIVVACRINNVKVYAYQHGPITKYHSGWNAYGIPSEYCNAVPDKLILWGAYWQNQLCKFSNKYNTSNTEVGAHLNKVIDYSVYNKYQSKQLKKELNVNRIKILIPYEFLANNLEISKYIEKFLDLGWEVCIKLRPVGDGDMNSDLLSYTQRVRDEVTFVYDLSDEDLAEFNAVVCTQSVFAVEMMRFSVPIWYLDTSVKFLSQLVDDGIAHPVCLDDLKKFHIRGFLEKFLVPRYSEEDYHDIFSEKKNKSFTG